MSFTTPKYGIEVPSPDTLVSELGAELQEMGVSIESVLDSFDYNGADPNLVLTRVSSLESNLTAAEAQILDLQAATQDTGWLPVSAEGNWVPFDQIEVRVKNGIVHLAGRVRGVGNGQSLICVLPPEARPDRGPLIFHVDMGTSGSTTVETARIVIQTNGDVEQSRATHTDGFMLRTLTGISFPAAS